MGTLLVMLGGWRKIGLPELLPGVPPVYYFRLMGDSRPIEAYPRRLWRPNVFWWSARRQDDCGTFLKSISCNNVPSQRVRNLDVVEDLQANARLSEGRASNLSNYFPVSEDQNLRLWWLRGGFNFSKGSHDKGRLGGREVELPPEEVKEKAQQLAQLIRGASFVVVHTGAGLSTSAGIPDFRGERGVWTLEEQGHPLPEYERCWDNAMPTLAHMALVGLMNRGLVHSIISQNVDGLHLRSGIPREKLCELHGNLFMEMCSVCKREFNRTADVGGVGFRPTGRRCPVCGEELLDVLLDWEDELRDYEKAVDLSERCGRPGGLALCLGTSLQISPSKDLPAQAETMAIVNLQRTAKDGRSALVIRAKIDAVMRHVMDFLSVSIPVYRRVENMVVSHTRTLLSGGRCRWTLTIGDTADGARCGYVESMTVSFPGNSFSDARVTRSPFRLTRVTRYPREQRDTSERLGATCQGSTTVPVAFVFTFVAAPGRTAPPSKHVEYPMDLSQSEGAQTVTVFLGEVDYS